MRARRLVLLRHGQTTYNAGDRMQGQIDTDLSELGRDQAVRAAEVLARRDPVAIISSDLRRAYDTAVTLAGRAGLPVHIDQRLRETNLGQWQGLTHSEVDAQFPGARSRWRGDATLSPPGGENRVQVAERVYPLIGELLADAGGEFAQWGHRPLVLVAHGGLIAALTARLLDLPVNRWEVLGGLGNASWVQLSNYGYDTGTSRWRLDVWNASAQVASDVL
jgi:broad specificity phosphatase PhoE